MDLVRDKLKAFIERIERQEEILGDEKQSLKDIYAEAKYVGFDTKILRHIVKLRKQEEHARLEFEALLDTYMSALGMVQPDA